MKKRNVLNSPRLSQLKRKKRRIFITKIFLYVVGFSIVFAGVVFLYKMPFLNISRVEVKGNKVIDADTIKAEVQKEISGDYFWFFPQTNILFYSKNNIKKDLVSKFKRIDELTLKVEGAGTLTVTLTEREGKYVWCGENFPALADHTCSFMDADGYIFDTAPYFSGNVYFEFFGTLTDDHFSPEIFKELLTFKDSLTNIGLKPIALNIKPDGDAEMYLNSDIATNYPKILFKKDADFKVIADNLQVALDTEPLKSDFKKKYSALSYIDLRFENKVYYKFK